MILLGLYSLVTVKLGVLLPLKGVGLVAGHEVVHFLNVHFVVLKHPVQFLDHVLQGVSGGGGGRVGGRLGHYIHDCLFIS